MRVVVSPDKFKGCLTAAQVTDAVANGLLEERPDLQITRMPVADGGDGTVAAALSRGFGEVTMSAAGPTGVSGPVSYARQGQRAVIELAAVCGLDRLPNGRPDALGASTYGLGEVIGHAIQHGAREVVLGIGGSASTDGGAGMAQALGARLLDASGAELAHGGAALSSLDSLDVAGLRDRMAGVRVLVASDVDNPLLGSRGAAAVFGPQKGASADDVRLLEDGLTRWARVVNATVGRDDANRPGAGAAGGTGFAALALLDAELRSGIELILELLRFDEAVAGADLVVTGEGSLDEQSLAGKAPIGVAQAAARVGVGVVAVAGRTQLSPDRLRAAGIMAAYPLSDLEPDPVRSIANAAPLLRQVGRIIAVEQLPS
ncbi:MAG TPA: glycerate kinase [Propionibacteriaceae bacterium]|nr:glycerate kinase [Propionibacteriaceae bacterium]